MGRLRRGLVPGLIVAAAAGAVAVVAVVVPTRKRTQAPVAPPPVNVTVEVVRPVPEVRDSFTLPGVVQPRVTVDVAAEVPGRIQRIPISEGDRVRKGQRLVLLNTELLQAEYDRAKARAEYDQREYERIASLRSRGAATRTEEDQARTQAAASRAAFEVARAKLARTRIAAPMSGIADLLPRDVGEYVVPGDVVARIVDVETVKVVVDVPELDVVYLESGQAAEVFPAGLGGEAIGGRITFISESADEQTRTSRVEVTVDNRSGRLRSGQIVRVRLPRRVLRNVILIPLDAVIPLEDGKAVYVVDEQGRARRRRVEVDLGLIQDAKRVRVTGELKAGDRLIVSGHRFVSEGTAVRVQSTAGGEPTSAPADGAFPRGGAAGAGAGRG